MERLRWKYIYACALKSRFGGSESELFELAELAWHHLRHLDPAVVATLELRRLRRRNVVPGRRWTSRSRRRPHRADLPRRGAS